MKEFYEFRVREKYARQLFADHEGERLGKIVSSIRKIKLASDDPRLRTVGTLNQEISANQDDFFFAGWQIHRSYSEEELSSARMFRLQITPAFEPTGEECGTVFDETTACQHCGCGRTQQSELILDLTQVPKRKEIARTIADEWIVSQRLAELMMQANISGFELRPVRHKALHNVDSINFEQMPIGRALIRQAEKAGIPYSSWKFQVWLNRSEQQSHMETVTEDYSHLVERRDAERPKQQPVWYQVFLTSSFVSTVSPTRFGINPFDDDVAGEYKCPLGHTAGLSLLSELFVSQASWDGSDMCCTKVMVGRTGGLLRPSPLILISPRFRELLLKKKVKGVSFEVAHLGRIARLGSGFASQ